MHSGKWIVLAIAAILGLGHSTPAQAVEPPAATEGRRGTSVAADSQDLSDLAKGLGLISRHADTLWPGFRLETIPFVFHHPGGPAYMLQHPAPFPAGFLPMPGNPAIGVQHVAFGFPRGIDTDYPLGGRRAVTVMLQPDLTWEQSLITAIHEAFHQHQHGRAFALRGSSTDLGVHSARDMALAEVEQTLLAEALEASGSTRGQERAHQFLAVRETRHRAVPAAMRATEETLETLEGTANYVEQRVRILAAERQTAIAFARTRQGALADLAKDLRHPLDERSFGRSRYYRTGAAMGFLLDHWLKDWPALAEKNRTPAELLARATRYRSDQRAGLMKMVESRFDVAGATRRHQTLFDQAQQRQAAALAAFERQPGLRVEVEIAFDHGGISVSTQGRSFPLPQDREYNDHATVSLENPAGTTVLLMGAIVSGHVLEGEQGFYHYTLYLPVRPEEVLLNGRPLPSVPGRYQGVLRWTSDRATVVSPKATVEVTPTRLRVRV